MKDIITKINESVIKNKYSEIHSVECTQEYKIERKIGGMTFKQGEQYEASKINDNWWLIEQFGVPSEDFKKYFKDV